jgi:hypothetical protein
MIEENDKFEFLVTTFRGHFFRTFHFQVDIKNVSFAAELHHLIISVFFFGKNGRAPD